ncbi:MAG: hypothetical protein ABSG46_02520 [Candidatus Binataceae bacterium]|jgi:hypothetical protein
MSNKQTQMVNDFAAFFEAALIDLPSAAARRLLSDEKDDQSLYKAGWKAYDAFVRIANESANQLYANPAFGQVTARGIEVALQARRASDSMASALFREVLPVLGLPAAKEIEGLNRSIVALREEVRTLKALQENAAQEPADAIDDYAAARAAESQNASARIIWNGLRSEGPRSARQEKKSVAL